MEWSAGEWERYISARQWVGAVTLRAVDGRAFAAVANAEILVLNGREWHISRLQLTDQPVAIPA